MYQDIVADLRRLNVITCAGAVNKNVNKMLSAHSLGQQLSHVTLFIDKIQQVTTYSERIYCVVHGLTAVPTCKCGKIVKFVTFAKGYQQFCGSKCANTDANGKSKRAATNTVRYGGRAPACSSDVQSKIKATNNDRYGADYHQQTSDVRQQTIASKYGSNSYLASQAWNSKRVDMLKESKADYFNQLTTSEDALEKLQDSNWLHNRHNVDQVPLYMIADELGVSTFCVRTYFQKHDLPIQRFGYSNPHRFVVDVIEELGLSGIVINDRKVIAPLELDILIPTLNIAFEINGNMWHSEKFGGRSRQYHLSKTESCRAAGYRLVHIFEHQIVNSPELVKSRIAQILGVQRHSVYARKCFVRRISNAEGSAFFDVNHIQGTASATYTYGLYHGSELVAAMSFGKPRFSKDEEWELIRFGSLLNHRVVGGASKLFRAFVKEHDPSSILSYCDLTWNTGSVYHKLGFNLKHSSAPNYWYFHTSKPLEVYHRSNFQKHKLDKLPQFDSSLSEFDNMINNGYDRYWDCGNLVFTWKK